MITNEEIQKAGIEEVVVNGMTMYKRRDRLFLTVEHAFFGNIPSELCIPHGRYEMDLRCMAVPYKQGDDIFKKIARGESLVALVKF